MDQVDKIVLSRDRSRCVVHQISGPSLHFNFMKLGLTYFEGVQWLKGVFGGNKKSAA